MQLVINERGAFISKKGNCFRVKRENKWVDISATTIDSITVSESATITTDAIKLAMEYNIDIFILDRYGYPIGRFWHAKFGSTTLIRRCQLRAYDSDIGLEIARDMIIKKIDNQRRFLKNLKRARNNKTEEIQKTIDILKTVSHKLRSIKGNIEEKRQYILGQEGYASRCYFETLGNLLPKPYKFKARSKQPAKDPFNCFLNYAYGILYNRIEISLIIAGLDPYIGFLHTDNYNKPSLVYDMIEQFRYIADRCVFFLFSRRQIKDKYFDNISNGVILNKEGRKILISAFNEEMEKEIIVNKRKTHTKYLISRECHLLAKKLVSNPELRK